jgi:hypothetical protein
MKLANLMLAWLAILVWGRSVEETFSEVDGGRIKLKGNRPCFILEFGISCTPSLQASPFVILGRLVQHTNVMLDLRASRGLQIDFSAAGRGGMANGCSIPHLRGQMHLTVLGMPMASL